MDFHWNRYLVCSGWSIIQASHDLKTNLEKFDCAARLGCGMLDLVASSTNEDLVFLNQSKRKKLFFKTDFDGQDNGEFMYKSAEILVPLKSFLIVFLLFSSDESLTISSRKRFGFTTLHFETQRHFF